MSDNGQVTEQSAVPVIEPENVPDFSVDAILNVVTAYGVTLNFQRQDFEQNTRQPHNVLVGRARMSHAQAWVMVQKLGGLLDKYVREVGPICLPNAVVDELDVREAYDEMQSVAKHGHD